jgi:hypothetical protein
MKGIVYGLKNENGIYIGSTTEEMKIRIKKHLYSFKKNKKYCSSFDIIRDEFEIIIFFENEIESKIELRKKEQEFITALSTSKCVNKMKSYLSKEERKEQRKKNRINEKEKRNEKFDCECGGKFIHKNRSSHFETIKHQQFLKQK